MRRCRGLMLINLKGAFLFCWFMGLFFFIEKVSGKALFRCDDGGFKQTTLLELQWDNEEKGKGFLFSVSNFTLYD